MTLDESYEGTPDDLSALLADLTGLADRERERADKLLPALATNRTIGIALGLIMAEHNLSEAAAFQVLRKFSQHQNRRVVDLASALITHHDELVQNSAPDEDHGQLD